MLNIKDVQADGRYLMIAARRSQKCWLDECESVRRWLATKPSSLSDDAVDAMLCLINSPLPPDAHPLAIIHCYADVPAGTKYGIAFDRDDPETNEFTLAEVMFGVAFSQYVDSTLSHGHHQTAVLLFPNGMPSLFDRLAWDAISSDYLCLCAESDFPDIKRCLVGSHLELLDAFLTDVNAPRWSSYALDRIFAEIDGDPKHRLLEILPRIDDRLLSSGQRLTEEQTHFLRHVTLHVYPTNTMTIDDMTWLIDRFRSVSTPQRALIIALLVRLDKLPHDVASKILSLLQGTPGDRYVAAEQADDPNAR